MKTQEFAEMLYANQHVRKSFRRAVLLKAAEEALTEVAEDDDMRFFRENLDSYIHEVER